MKIALLGYGKEGKATEKYFLSHFNDVEIDIFDNETPVELQAHDYTSYDFVFRSPSIPPLGLANETSITRFFFDHCPCKIIGVTATKGKGTTCSFIKALLDSGGHDAYLVGNIGVPALEVLDSLTETSVVIYEMSSFQLWDLNKSPFIAVIGQLEPDHINVHGSYENYLAAKANIVKYQTSHDYCIFYQNNPDSVSLAELSPATHRFPYPFSIPTAVQSAITLPGQHNQNNAIAAIAAVACYLQLSPQDYIETHQAEIIAGLASFHGLPHRLEFLRELRGVKYYDDNFSTNPSSTRVAVDAFPGQNLVIIVGGRDKTNNADIPEIYDILKTPNIKSIILLGESGRELKNRYQDSRFLSVSSLEQAVSSAQQIAENLGPRSIVLMSPSAASFDMFKDVYERGRLYQTLVSALN